MSYRRAFEQAGLVIPAGVLLALLWVVLVGVDVGQTMQPLFADVAVGPWVGQTWTAGFVGLLVLGVVAVSLVYMASELGEDEPAPEPFPPDQE